MTLVRDTRVLHPRIVCARRRGGFRRGCAASEENRDQAEERQCNQVFIHVQLKRIRRVWRMCRGKLKPSR